MQWLVLLPSSHWASSKSRKCLITSTNSYKTSGEQFHQPMSCGVVRVDVEELLALSLWCWFRRDWSSSFSLPFPFCLSHNATMTWHWTTGKSHLCFPLLDMLLVVWLLLCSEQFISFNNHSGRWWQWFRVKLWSYSRMNEWVKPRGWW